MRDLQYTQGSLSLRIENPLPSAVVVVPRKLSQRRERRSLQDARIYGIPEHKRCRDCDQIKPSIEFNRNKGDRDGLANYCKPCSRLRNKGWWKHYQGKADRHEAQHAKNLQQKYGMSIDEYNDRVDQQQGQCLVCGDTPKRLVVDHDHESGLVRGLLCSSCNVALGNMRDRPDLMIAGAQYLERYSK